MAEKSEIEWTDATWNPITGCSLVSEGCRNCYAAGLAATRLKNHPSRVGLARKNADGVAKFTGEVRFNEQWHDQPLRWRRGRKIFVCAHGDLFHESVPDEWIDHIFAVMALCPQHTFQVLTKRPERMLEYMTRLNSLCADSEDGIAPMVEAVAEAIGIDPRVMQDVWPLPNVWLGVSVEDQATADERIPLLLDTPAAKRFISAEPLLGPVDLTPHLWGRAAPCNECPQDGDCGCGFYPRGAVPNEPALDWVIIGGESGPRARGTWVPYIRAIMRQCQQAGTSVFVKQMGSFVTDRNDAGFEGCEPTEWPDGYQDRIEEDQDGTSDGFQGAPVRIRLYHRKGKDMAEWPEDLRVREFPA